MFAVAVTVGADGVVKALYGVTVLVAAAKFAEAVELLAVRAITLKL